MNDFIIPAYKRLPIAFERGEGVWLWDTDGKKYLDTTSGIGVSILGHSHPAILAAITQQASELLHISNGYRIPEQENLAKKLSELSGMSQAFFNHSGAEANETAIKIARLYGHSQGITSPQILVAEKSFHGRTFGALSASNPKTHIGFEPVLTGFIRVPYNDISAIEHAFENHPEIVALLLEPIQGNAGIILPEQNYLKTVRERCDEQACLMMLDEVQTGIGHTGKLFAYEHEEIVPDVLCLAKGLGNGIPIGACLVHGAAKGILQPGQHGSTLGGNPFATYVALTVLQTLENDNVLENATKVGEYLLKGLRQTLGSKPIVTHIRGKALMIAIELDRPAAELKKFGLEEGLLLNITAQNIIRLLPPLILTQEEADMIITRLNTCLDQFISRNK
jgi:acetylornithine/N-succinyldiaminopimelate aminotransferase